MIGFVVCIAFLAGSSVIFQKALERAVCNRAFGHACSKVTAVFTFQSDEGVGVVLFKVQLTREVVFVFFS